MAHRAGFVLRTLLFPAQGIERQVIPMEVDDGSTAQVDFEGRRLAGEDQ